jgi:hypothetical protein
MSILGREAKLEAANPKWRKNATAADGGETISKSYFGGCPGGLGKLGSKGMFRALSGPSVWVGTRGQAGGCKL